MTQGFREYLSKAIKAKDAKYGEPRDPRKMIKKHPLSTGTKDGTCRCNCTEEKGAPCQCIPDCKVCGGAYTCRDSLKMQNAKDKWENLFRDTRKGKPQ